MLEAISRKGIQASIVLHSVGPNDAEIITYAIKYPRAIHAEVMTHRMFERNGASSRAKPIQIVMREVWEDPWVPLRWAKRTKGMQPGGSLKGWRQWLCRKLWLSGRNIILLIVWALWRLGLAKETANRLLEPWHHMILVITGTRDCWPNFFALRCHSSATIEIQTLACKMGVLLRDSVPKKLGLGEWHLPFIDDEDRDYMLKNDCVYMRDRNKSLVITSAARCARISYSSFVSSGKRSGIDEDAKIYVKLVGSTPVHATPTGHQAIACNNKYVKSGPFTGWVQYRKLIVGESVRHFDLQSDEFKALCRELGVE